MINFFFYEFLFLFVLKLVMIINKFLRRLCFLSNCKIVKSSCVMLFNLMIGFAVTLLWKFRTCLAYIKLPVRDNLACWMPQIMINMRFTENALVKIKLILVLSFFCKLALHLFLCQFILMCYLLRWYALKWLYYGLLLLALRENSISKLSALNVGCILYHRRLSIVFFVISKKYRAS